MKRQAALRASDEDREQVAERLRQATAEGRLLTEELEQRLEAVFSARTYGELDALVADLPAGGIERRRQASIRPWVLPAIGIAIAIPIAVAIVAVVLFVLTGLFAAWALWLLLGWWMFGHRHPHRSRRPVPGVRMYAAPRRAHPRPGFWL